MAALTPSQVQALLAAAADSHGELRRTRGGYASDAKPTDRHSSRAVYGLERFGLLSFAEPGRHAAAAFARAAQVAA